nr:hypothetical protein [Streptomyces hyaluromycini]
MAHLRSRCGPALAAPVVLSPTARATSAADGPNPACVVNTRTDRDTIESVQRVIARNAGTIIATYDKIGVIVAHSADPDFGAATLNAASAGDSNDDLDAHALTDDSGPDDSTAAPRTVDPHATPARLPALLKAEADNPDCPDRPAGPYDGDGDGIVDAACVGGKDVDGFHGSGVVDALRAVK